MVVAKATRFLSDKQKIVMKECEAKLAALYDDNDNSFTYALTGLLNHLLQLADGNVWASSYVREKIELLEECLK